MPGSPPPPCPDCDSGSPREDEEAARELLTPLIEGQLVRAQPPAPDFLICREGVVVGGVEVTLYTDSYLRQLGAELGRSGYLIEDQTLTATWAFELARLTDLRTLDRGTLVKLAHLLEAEPETANLSPLPRDPYGRLGIRTAYRFEGGKARAGRHRIHLMMPTVGGFATASAVYEAVAQAAQRKAKQLRRISGERHLFIWVDSWMIGAEGALEDPPPAEPLPPRLPDGVDHVWVAGTSDRRRLPWHRAATDPTWAAAEVGPAEPR